MEEKRTLTVSEMMVVLSVGRKKAYQLVNSEGFPSFRIGRKILVNRDGLFAWISRQEEKRNEDF